MKSRPLSRTRDFALCHRHTIERGDRTIANPRGFSQHVYWCRGNKEICTQKRVARKFVQVRRDLQSFGKFIHLGKVYI